MTKNNEEMIEEIRDRLNLVNQSLINPEKYKSADAQEVKEVYDYVTRKPHLRQVKLQQLQMRLDKFVNKGEFKYGAITT